MSLRDALREDLSEEELMQVVSAAVKRKKKQHAGRYSNIIFLGQKLYKWSSMLVCTLIFGSKVMLIFLVKSYTKEAACWYVL